ncbi:hypothetical protein JCGZ_17654 [Jatropha curcas]|uniref:Embryo sac development arrest 6 n=1 Tax=Jatropha curcas TaxID=180498 RepID=A0A067JRB3_JATCU|nr:uncharacterized protein LOC105644503 [Jatropha curcas]KDP26496.1 hypothetical protein JCGZ_17654 [Jatropha curcas]
MNTKTMRLPPRRFLTSNKRKEREGFDSLKPSPPPPPAPPTKLPKPTINRLDSGILPEPAPSNQLLAGYLAHEYLTKGTLFGQPWAPSRAEAVPVSAGFVESKKIKASQKAKEAEPNSNKETYERYVDVSCLLKAGGAHLPGVVNPSQLARFL